MGGLRVEAQAPLTVWPCAVRHGGIAMGVEPRAPRRTCVRPCAARRMGVARGVGDRHGARWAEAQGHCSRRGPVQCGTRASHAARGPRHWDTGGGTGRCTRGQWGIARDVGLGAEFCFTTQHLPPPRPPPLWNPDFMGGGWIFLSVYFFSTLVKGAQDRAVLKGRDFFLLRTALKDRS